MGVGDRGGIPEERRVELARLQHLDKDDAYFTAGGAVTGESGSAAGPWQNLIVKTNADRDSSGHYTTTTPAGVTLRIVLLRLSTVSAGVLAGRKTPSQSTNSSKGYPACLMVGTSGSNALR